MKRKNLNKKITAAILAAALACSPLQAISVAAEQQSIQPIAESQSAEAAESTPELQAESTSVYASPRAASYAGTTADTAAELPLNQEKIWAMQPREEGAYDYIRFTTTSSPDTFYTFTFENIGNEAGNLLDCEVSKTPYFTEADRVEDIIYTLNAGRSITQNFKKLEPAHTYYIRIKESYSSLETELSYRLKITAIEDDVKDSGEAAKPISINSPVSAALQNGMDVDVFAFQTLDTDSFYTFTLENIGNEAGNLLDCEVSKTPYFTEADRVEDIIYTLNAGRSITQNFKKLEPAHTYYIRIKESYSSLETELPYSFKITAIEDDVKDSGEAAKPISVNSSVSAALQNYADVDVFTFKAPDTDSFYEFHFANQGEKALQYSIYDNIELADDANDALPKYFYVGGKQKPKPNDLKKLKRNHTYYVVVRIVEWEAYEAPIPYTISVNSRLDDANNKVNNGDDKPANATAIKAGTTVKKALQNISDEDYFKFTVSGNENFYELTLKNYGNATINCGIWKKEGSGDPIKMVGEPLRSGNAGPNAEGASTINLGLLKKGTYYIRITRGEHYSEFNATEKYTLKLATKKDDVKQINGSNMSTARKLALNKEYSFAIDNAEDEDYFQFKASGFNHRLSFSNLGKGTLHITIYKTKNDVERGIIWGTYTCSGKGSCVSGDAEKLNRLGEDKTYYIKITGDGETKAKYKVGITATAPSVKKPKKVAAKKIKLSWSKVSKATGYIIYRSNTRNGKYKKIKTITKNSTLTYTDKNLKKGKYFYKIKAYRKKKNKSTEYSGYSNIQGQKL